MSKCKYTDLQARYYLTYAVDENGENIISTECTEFDEYYCHNCDTYSCDLDSNHVGAM